jgi:6-methylsalicylate decarboxylase
MWEAWRDSGELPPRLTLPPWSVELDLSFLDQHNIDMAILSVSAPGVGFARSTDQAKDLARKLNDEAAAIRDAHPTRYGFFATLPLSNIQDGVDELCRALDVLKADGVTLFTSYEGRYLGHEDFAPLWRELDRRGAVAFIHPATAQDPGAAHDRAIPRPIIDFPHETTRTAVHLITSETVRDHPNCKIILSHGGGTLPFVATRIAHQAADVGLIAKTADEFLAEAKSFYFDTAMTGFKGPIGLLGSFAAEGHVLWGSDYPFARGKTVETQQATLAPLEGEDSTRLSIMHGAAGKLFPRLSGRAA